LSAGSRLLVLVNRFAAPALASRFAAPALASRFAALAALAFATGIAAAHPGNVVATLTPRAQGPSVQLEAVLTFDGTGEPLLGARPGWSLPGEARQHPFGFGGGPNVHVADLPRLRGSSPYVLHILSLGETTETTFTLSGGDDRLSATPREALLVFPDVGVPDDQLVLIVVAVVVGMALIIVRKPAGPKWGGAG
jgi:hypothetical protein